MTNTEYINAISDGFGIILRNFGIRDNCDLRNAVNYLIQNSKYPKSVLEDEDKELVAYRNALEFIILNITDYDFE